MDDLIRITIRRVNLSDDETSIALHRLAEIVRKGEDASSRIIEDVDGNIIGCMRIKKKPPATMRVEVMNRNSREEFAKEFDFLDTITDLQQRIEFLGQMKEKAVALRDFELAAQLRDEADSLRGLT